MATVWKRDGLEVWATEPCRINLTTAGTVRICLVDDHHSESRFEERHADLIAAAPEMLEALNDELDAVRDDLRWADGGEMERLMHRRTRLETIIAKAEGRS